MQRLFLSALLLSSSIAIAETSDVYDAGNLLSYPKWREIQEIRRPAGDTIVAVNGKEYPGVLGPVPGIDYSFGTLNFRTEELAMVFFHYPAPGKVLYITNKGETYAGKISAGEFTLLNKDHSRTPMTLDLIQAVILQESPLRARDDSDDMFAIEMNNGDRFIAKILDEKIAVGNGWQDFTVQTPKIRWMSRNEGIFIDEHGRTEKMESTFVRDRYLKISIPKMNSTMRLPYDQIYLIKRYNPAIDSDVIEMITRFLPKKKLHRLSPGANIADGSAALFEQKNGASVGKNVMHPHLENGLAASAVLNETVEGLAAIDEELDRELLHEMQANHVAVLQEPAPVDEALIESTAETALSINEYLVFLNFGSDEDNSPEEFDYEEDDNYDDNDDDDIVMKTSSLALLEGGQVPKGLSCGVHACPKIMETPEPLIVTIQSAEGLVEEQKQQTLWHKDDLNAFFTPVTAFVYDKAGSDNKRAAASRVLTDIEKQLTAFLSSLFLESKENRAGEKLIAENQTGIADADPDSFENDRQGSSQEKLFEHPVACVIVEEDDDDDELTDSYDIFCLDDDKWVDNASGRCDELDALAASEGACCIVNQDESIFDETGYLDGAVTFENGSPSKEQLGASSLCHKEYCIGPCNEKSDESLPYNTLIEEERLSNSDTLAASKDSANEYLDVQDALSASEGVCCVINQQDTSCDETGFRDAVVAYKNDAASRRTSMGQVSANIRKDSHSSFAFSCEHDEEDENVFDLMALKGSEWISDDHPHLVESDQVAETLGLCCTLPPIEEDAPVAGVLSEKGESENEESYAQQEDHSESFDFEDHELAHEGPTMIQELYANHQIMHTKEELYLLLEDRESKALKRGVALSDRSVALLQDLLTIEEQAEPLASEIEELEFTDDEELASVLEEEREKTMELSESGEAMVLVDSEFLLSDFTSNRKEKSSLLPTKGEPVVLAKASAFYIDTDEVSNAQYQQFVNATGHRPPEHWVDGHYSEGEARKPVVNISYRDAEAFATWSGKRLPKKEEWLRAAALGVIHENRSLDEWVAMINKPLHEQVITRHSSSLQRGPLYARQPSSHIGFRCVKDVDVSRK